MYNTSSCFLLRDGGIDLHKIMAYLCSRGQIVFSSLHRGISSHCLVTLTEDSTSKCYQSGFQMTNWGLTPHEVSSFGFERSESIIWTQLSKCTIRMILTESLSQFIEPMYCVISVCLTSHVRDL